MSSANTDGVLVSPVAAFIRRGTHSNSACLLSFSPECLFDNSHWIDGDQKYDTIIDDIEPLVEEGYRVCVTGHG